MSYLNRLKIAKPFSRSQIVETAQKRIADLYKFLKLYHRIETLFCDFERSKLAEYEKYKKEHSEEPTKSEWNEEYEFEVFPKFRKSASEIMVKHKINKDFLYSWRDFLAENSLINESGRSPEIRRAYVRALGDNEIVNLEDINYMIYVINTTFQ